MHRCRSLARRLASGLLALPAFLAAAACYDDGVRSCTAMGCAGILYEIVLVDEAGEPVSARGEYRSRNSWSSTGPARFDCPARPADAGSPPICADGRVAVGSVDMQPDARAEVRFELRDGSWSEWQALTLDITSHTDPDFNGPGCSCTWYTATAAPVVVPAEAHLPAP